MPYVNCGSVNENDIYENVDSSVVHPSHVYVSLSNSGDKPPSDVDKKSSEPAPGPHVSQVTTTVTAYRSEGKMTIVATAPRPIQFRVGQTAVTETQKPPPGELERPRPAGPSVAPTCTEAPRPIHFKLGHAHSLEPSDNRNESQENVAAGDDVGGTSVAAMIKKLNTRL